MKPLPDLLFKLRHSVEGHGYAVFDATDAKSLLDAWQRREGLLREARSHARGEPMSKCAMSPTRLAEAVDRELDDQPVRP